MGVRKSEERGGEAFDHPATPCNLLDLAHLHRVDPAADFLHLAQDAEQIHLSIHLVVLEEAGGTIGGGRDLSLPKESPSIAREIPGEDVEIASLTPEDAAAREDVVIVSGRGAPDQARDAELEELGSLVPLAAIVAVGIESVLVDAATLGLSLGCLGEGRLGEGLIFGARGQGFVGRVGHLLVELGWQGRADFVGFLGRLLGDERWYATGQAGIGVGVGHGFVGRGGSGGRRGDVDLFEPLALPLGLAVVEASQQFEDRGSLDGRGAALETIVFLGQGIEVVVLGGQRTITG